MVKERIEFVPKEPIVVLPLSEYQKMCELLEDLEDRLLLDEAERETHIQRLL
jgi:hypothetical protein